VTNLTPGIRYFFVVQAYNTSGLTSPNSAEVFYDVPASSGPTITSLTPASGPVGTSITIAGSAFGATQGTSTVTFNGTAASPTSWTASSIVVPVPAGATTGNVVVTVGGVASNGVSFTVTVAGSITLVQHAGVDAGGTSAPLAFASNNTAGNFIAVAVRAFTTNQTITVTDSRGNTYQQAVKFNNGTDDTVGVYFAQNIGAGANTVTVSLSASASLRFAIFEYSGIASANALDVTATNTSTSASPTSGAATTTTSGDLLLGVFSTQSLRTFTAGSGYTIREAVSAAPSTALMVEDIVQGAAGSTSATATVDSSDLWGAALVAFKPASGGGPTPSITSLSPTSGAVTLPVTITGTNFGATQGTRTVKFNGTTATPTSWSATSIVAPVPAGATTGNVTVTVGGVASNGSAFTVVPTATITSLSPTSGAVTLPVTITGTNFGATQGTSTVALHSTTATPTTWSATSIVAPVPAGATTGNVTVTVGGGADKGR